MRSMNCYKRFDYSRRAPREEDVRLRFANLTYRADAVVDSVTWTGVDAILKQRRSALNGLRTAKIADRHLADCGENSRLRPQMVGDG